MTDRNERIKELFYAVQKGMHPSRAMKEYLEIENTLKKECVSLRSENHALSVKVDRMNWPEDKKDEKIEELQAALDRTAKIIEEQNNRNAERCGQLSAALAALQSVYELSTEKGIHELAAKTLETLNAAPLLHLARLERDVIQKARDLRFWCNTTHGHVMVNYDEFKKALEALNKARGRESGNE